jgi:hypothetical protein
VGDHPGLGEVDAAVTDRGRELGPPAVERDGEVEVAALFGAVGAGLAGEPGRDVAFGGHLGHVAGRRHDAEPERHELVTRPLEAAEGLGLLVRRHELGRHVGDVLQRGLDGVRTGQEWVNHGGTS